jgi:acetolactate decarboxylase
VVGTAIDERLARALHVEVLRRGELHSEHEPHLLFQASTIGALLDGAYDGDVTIGELKQHGDFGLGTFNACDGEMVVLDGSVYRARVDGSVAEAEDTEMTPFALVTFFEPQVRVPVKEMDHETLLEALEASVSGRRACEAIRLRGRFARVRARSVPQQSKPYPPLTEVVGHQRVFDLQDVEGTLVGFRFAAYAEGVNVPGYHLHFLSADRRRGGHVLECEPLEGTIEIDHGSELHLELPTGVELGEGTEHVSADALRRVEREG